MLNVGGRCRCPPPPSSSSSEWGWEVIPITLIIIVGSADTLATLIKSFWAPAAAAASAPPRAS